MKRVTLHAQGYAQQEEIAKQRITRRPVSVPKKRVMPQTPDRVVIRLNGTLHAIHRDVANYIRELQQENYSISTRVPGYTLMGRSTVPFPEYVEDEADLDEAVRIP